MRKFAVSLAALCVAAPGWGGEPAPASASAPAPARVASPIPASTRQLLVVRSSSWKAVTGALQRFERSPQGGWQAWGDPVSVNVGRRGMAWGRGLQSVDEAGPLKKEGDQRAPAGAFLLGQAFGYPDELPSGAKRYPYLHIVSRTACIEDQNSKYYNQLIDVTTIAQADWSTTDPMLRPDGLFRRGVVVDQNGKDTQPGAGSCVFLHVWRGRGQGTAGCTTMAPEAIEDTIRWLDPAERPVLVQLPELEYARLRAAWALP